MKIHTGQNKVSCTLCAISFSRASNLAAHNKKFAYEHLCMENGNSKLSAFSIKIEIKIIAIAEFSCALDERLAGSSDENAEEQQYDNMRSLFSHHADRHSSVYVLLESLPGAATNRVFSAFISQIFYVGSTTALHTRGKTHASLPEVGFYSNSCHNLHRTLCFSRRRKYKKCGRFGRRAALSI